MIEIIGTNLKINNLSNLAPEKGSRLTIFFDDVSNQVFKDTEFMVANNMITAYSSDRFRKVAQVYFESPTLGLKNTRNGTTVTKVPVNKPSITGYEVDNYGVYDMLIINGKNLLVSSKRSDKDEEILVILRDGTSTTYSSNQFFGGSEEVNIIGSVDEFKNVDTIYFESKSRGLSQTTNKLSLVNIASFVSSLFGKVMAATTDVSQTQYGRKIASREAAYDNLLNRIERIVTQIDAFDSSLFETDSLNSNDNNSSSGVTIQDIFENFVPTRDTVDMSIWCKLTGGRETVLYACDKTKELETARSWLADIERNDPVLTMWNTAARYQADGTLPSNFGLKYYSNGVIVADFKGNTSAVNQILNNSTKLNALAQIGTSASASAYSTPNWMSDVQRNTGNNNSGSSNSGGEAPTLFRN